MAPTAGTPQHEAKTTRIHFAWSISFLASLLIAAGILWHLHDQFWWPPDDGVYAYVADQINQGALLHRDIQSLHFGLVNFINAASLRAFGNDLVSLRYPLLIATILQAALVASLFLRANPLSAIAVAVALSLLTFIQFANPGASWYALFFACVLVFSLQRFRSDTAPSLIWIGLLIGAIFCLRQLSGAIAGIGAVSYLYWRNHPIEHGARETWTRTIVAKVVSASFLLIVAVYLVFYTGSWFLFFFGVAPMALLIVLAYSTRLNNPDALRLAGLPFIGFLLPVFPLLIYHALHGSVSNWLNDAVVAAMGMTELPFLETRLYADMLIYAGMKLTTLDPVATLNSLFWISLLLAPIILGISVLLQAATKHREIAALAWFPTFFALASGHYEIPIYLFYTSALTLAGLAWQSLSFGSRGTMAVSLFLIILTVTGTIFHAAQPLSRGISGSIKGNTVSERVPCDLSRCSLDVEPDVAMVYQELIEFIDAQSGPEDLVLAIPFNPELNYLSKRRSPVRFYNSALGLRTNEQVAEALDQISRSSTQLIIHNPTDKYNSPALNPLLRHTRDHYIHIATVGPFHVYKARQHKAQ